jgi:hypothetical protein
VYYSFLMTRLTLNCNLSETTEAKYIKQTQLKYFVACQY